MYLTRLQHGRQRNRSHTINRTFRPQPFRPQPLAWRGGEGRFRCLTVSSPPPASASPARTRSKLDHRRRHHGYCCCRRRRSIRNTRATYPVVQHTPYRVVTILKMKSTQTYSVARLIGHSGSQLIHRKQNANRRKERRKFKLINSPVVPKQASRINDKAFDKH